MLQHDCVHLATREQDKNIWFNTNLNEGEILNPGFGKGHTSFSRPLVKDGESMLRILFHCSSSVMDTASRSGPFRPKSWMKHIQVAITAIRPLLMYKVLVSYPSVSEVRVTLLNQDGFDYQSVHDTHQRLSTIEQTCEKKTHFMKIKLHMSMMHIYIYIYVYIQRCMIYFPFNDTLHSHTLTSTPSHIFCSILDQKSGFP